MEDSASKRAYLVATIFTLKYFLTANAIIAWVYDATVAASVPSAVGLLEHIVQTRIVVWKELVELFDGKLVHTHVFLHTSIVLQRLHDVKGYSAYVFS